MNCTASPGENINAQIIFEKSAPVSEGRYQLFVDGIKIPEGTDRFTVKAYGVQNLHLVIKNFIWLNSQSDGSGGIATINRTYITPLNYDVHIYGNVSGTSSICTLRLPNPIQSELIQVEIGFKLWTLPQCN